MKRTNAPIIAGIGEILWDRFPEGKKLGGAPANVVYHASRLGVGGIVISALGTDRDGDEIISKLDSISIDNSMIFRDENHGTGAVNVKLDEAGRAEYIFEENTAWDFIPFSNSLKETAGKVNAVCFGTLAQRGSQTRETIYRFLKATRKNCLKVYDLNLRPPYYSEDIICESLKFADILKLNSEELNILNMMMDLGGSEDRQIRQLISRYDLHLVALTKGEHGSRLSTGSQDISSGAATYSVVDTVGAGDAYTAALIVGLLNKAPMNKIHACAESLAKYVCMSKGATPVISKDLIDRLSADLHASEDKLSYAAGDPQ